MILHPKGDCFTYFSRDGKKLRQLSRFAVNNTYDGGILNKVTLGVQFVNTYGLEPLINREEFTNDFEKIQHVTKYT